MDFQSMVKIMSDAGIAVVAVGSIIFMSWKLLQWGKQIVDGVLVQMAKQNEAWQATVDRATSALDEHSRTAGIFHNGVVDAHKYQREEHKEANDKLTKQGVVADNMLKLIEKISINLDEQSKVLSRINGYTHEGEKGDKGDKGDRGEKGDRGQK